jgi:putative endonuclease
MASQRNGTIYTGVTSDLKQRAFQHRNNMLEGFTLRYGCKLLVWYEVHDAMDEAITREKRIKEWQRAWKLRLIEQANPAWDDLYESLF